jgi:hypothetical protein
MKLAKAVELLNKERLEYLEFYTGTITGVERAGTLSAWVAFRSSDCPDVDAKEARALKAVRKYVAEIQQVALDNLGQTYTC